MFISNKFDGVIQVSKHDASLWRFDMINVRVTNRNIGKETASKLHLIFLIDIQNNSPVYLIIIFSSELTTFWFSL